MVNENKINNLKEYAAELKRNNVYFNKGMIKELGESQDRLGELVKAIKEETEHIK